MRIFNLKDIDEDLHILELNDESSNQNENFKIVNMYENKLKTSESRIEELSEMVQKLRFVKLLTKRKKCYVYLIL